jgi:hypothetical protein
VFWGPAGGQGKDGCLLVFWAQKVCNWWYSPWNLQTTFSFLIWWWTIHSLFRVSSFSGLRRIRGLVSQEICFWGRDVLRVGMKLASWCCLVSVCELFFLFPTLLWWKSNGLGFCYSFVFVYFLIFGVSLVEFKALGVHTKFRPFSDLFCFYVDLQRLCTQQIYIDFCIHWKFHCIVARKSSKNFQRFLRELDFFSRMDTEGRTQRRSTRAKFWFTDSEKIRARNHEPWYWQRLFAISSWSRQDPLPGSNIESTRGLHHLKGIG